MSTPSILSPALGNLTEILKSEGPKVQAVLLKADGTTAGVTLDTTPSASHAAQILGGPITFLGQYEDECLMILMRRDDKELPPNSHRLQPPFDQSSVRGDLLLVHVAADAGDEASHDDFFGNYTVEEYQKFAARTDVRAPVVPKMEEEEEEPQSEEEEEDEVEGEEDDSEEEADFMELLMEQLVARFQEQHGRAPQAEELMALQQALAQKME